MVRAPENSQIAASIMGDTVRSKLSNFEHQVNNLQTNKEELRERLLKASWVNAEDEEENQRYERF